MPTCQTTCSTYCSRGRNLTNFLRFLLLSGFPSMFTIECNSVRIASIIEYFKLCSSARVNELNYTGLKLTTVICSNMF